MYSVIVVIIFVDLFWFGVALPQGFDIIKCGFFYLALWIYFVFSICGDYICRSVFGS